MFPPIIFFKKYAKNSANVGSEKGIFCLLAIFFGQPLPPVWAEEIDAIWVFRTHSEGEEEGRGFLHKCVAARDFFFFEGQLCIWQKLILEYISIFAKGKKENNYTAAWPKVLRMINFYLNVFKRKTAEFVGCLLLHLPKTNFQRNVPPPSQKLEERKRVNFLWPTSARDGEEDEEEVSLSRAHMGQAWIIHGITHTRTALSL